MIGSIGVVYTNCNAIDIGKDASTSRSSSSDDSDEAEATSDCTIDEDAYVGNDFPLDEGWDPDAQELNINEEDPGALRILTAISEDGISWERNHEIFIDQAGALDVVTDKEGRIFLYYMNVDDEVVVAVSEDDGGSWVHKYVTFVGQEGKIVDTATLNLADGTFRNYFMSQFPGDATNLIRSATSCDGITYTIEDGARVESMGSGSRLTAPKVMALNGDTHLYLIDENSSDKNEHFVSSDGLFFDQYQNIDLDIILASSLTIGGQKYSYGQKVNVPTGQPNFSIYYTTTTDGDAYTSSNEIFGVDPTDENSLDFFLMKKPVVVQLTDESYLMFYLTGFKCEVGITTPDAEYNCP